MKRLLKRMISLVCICALLVSTMGVHAYVVGVNWEDTILVCQTEGGYEEVTAESAHEMNNTAVIFELTSEDGVIYTPIAGTAGVAEDFRILREADGTLHPLHEVRINLESDDPLAVLREEYGHNDDDRLYKDIKRLLDENESEIDAITVYTIPMTNGRSLPEPFTTQYNGKTVSTRYVRVDGSNGNRGQNIVQYGKNGMTETSNIEDVEMQYSESRSTPRTRGIAKSVVSFFGEMLAEKIKADWEEPSTTTHGYIAEYTSYTNYIRYTSVLENGQEYLGCISNQVEVTCSLTYYGVGSGVSPSVISPNELEDVFETENFTDKNALKTTVNNYLSSTVIDRIDCLYLHVSYPNGSNKAFSEKISY